MTTPGRRNRILNGDLPLRDGIGNGPEGLVEFQLLVFFDTIVIDCDAGVLWIRVRRCGTDLGKKRLRLAMVRFEGVDDQL